MIGFLEGMLVAAVRRPAVLTLLLAAAAVSAPAVGRPADAPIQTDAHRAVAQKPDLPFGVGERMDFRLRAKWFLIGGSGSARLEVEAIDTVHGFPTFRLALAMKGGIAVYRIDDVQRSWLDVDRLFSRRFHQKLDQTTYQRDRTLDFFPDEMRFVERGKPEGGGELATARPLDDVSFLYHIRTPPLVVGEVYRESRYYKDEGNPVVVRVLRTERITVPAGEFDAIVLEPRIRASGLFGEDGEALVWLSNDERRLLLKLVAKISIATLTMELESYTTAAASPGKPD